MSVPTIHPGSILDCDVDVIVNPANGFLMHGGGLARVIADAAAPKDVPEAATVAEARRMMRVAAEWRAQQRSIPTIPTGGAAWTSAGVLPYRGIIHAVGPVWGGGNYYEELLLRAAYSNALSIAEERGYKSIAFPAISCGLFRFPVDKAAPIAVQTCYLTKLEVTFALMEAEHVEAFGKELDKLSRHERNILNGR